VKIPLRYDVETIKRGLWIDYLMINDVRPGHSKSLCACQVDTISLVDTEKKVMYTYYDDESVLSIVDGGTQSVMVVDVLVGQHDAYSQIRG
jgi:hypothetical protein